MLLTLFRSPSLPPTPTPASRIGVVASDQRVVAVQAADRVVVVQAASRTVTIQ